MLKMELILKHMLVISVFITVNYGFGDRNNVQVNASPRKTQKKNQCCQNGGICILGTLCKCKKNYFGRRCQHKVEFKPCGNIPHGAWIRSDCNLCKCFDGDISCIPRIYDGCDYDSPILDSTAPTKDPLKARFIKILDNDRDFQDVKQLDDYNLEDYYYMDDENSSTRLSVSTPLINLVILAALLTII